MYHRPKILRPLPVFKGRKLQEIITLRITQKITDIISTLIKGQT